MHRKQFIKALALLPLGLAAKKAISMNLQTLSGLSDGYSNTDRMPVLFVGHGNPMNAISQNPYRSGWAQVGKQLPRPNAILCVSAHWLTNGTAVTMSAKPKTIHDFGGFPDELYKVQYAAPGSPEYAELTRSTAKSVKVAPDNEWGLDHGAWSVLMNMYPDADIPVFQMSIDFGKAPIYHYNLARELQALRSKGVLIVASGNIVHNLGMVSWDNSVKKYDWAIEFDSIVKKAIENRNDDALTGYQKLGKLATMAHPSNDHYLPLMYTIGLRDKKDELRFFNDSFDLGSVSMRSLIFSS
jgi:4,5-DOPA dioxygenase extradiol